MIHSTSFRSVRSLLRSLVPGALLALGVVMASASDASAQGRPSSRYLPMPVAAQARGIDRHRHPGFRRPVPRPRVVIVHAPPPPPVVAEAPRDEHGLLVLPYTHLRVGQRVLIQWGGSWYYNGTVRATLSDGTVRVNYDGWNEFHDETVPRSRLRLPR